MKYFIPQSTALLQVIFTRLLVFLFLTLLIFKSQFAHSKVWRVNADVGVSADFSSLTDAIAAAAPGDTLYIEPGNYGSSTTQLIIDKNLVIIGTGYAAKQTRHPIDENDSTWYTTVEAELGWVRIMPPGNGQKLIGLYMRDLEIWNDSVTITRCKITNNTGSDNMDIISGVSNVTISGNYIYNRVGNSVEALVVGENCSDILISNNIIVNHSGANNIFKVDENGSNVTVANNIIIGNIDSRNTLFLHNILVSGVFNPDPFYQNIFYYNISHDNSFGTLNGNQSNIPQSSIFTLTGSFDARYQLKDDIGTCPPTCNPAKGTGINGADLGIFGGNDPYVLSGMPPIPAIFDAQIEIDSTATKLNVNVDAKSHK